MSFPLFCGPCVRGDHAHHVPHEGGQGLLIGGTDCPCPGDCKLSPMEDVLTQILQTGKATITTGDLKVEIDYNQPIACTCEPGANCAGHSQ